ncbi:hypothetical protein GSI_08948 [Ganoderma sinense ZZ0214-1]|uniref:Uncharacterized protein n=1 Tax=Ganoderma sinense ZZ0214-1 TaxID=1077348 RepID=A0A2G8S555_9APHY|nr:hypothetical protein GSI_08948 [Ganoderma sinense ZZ0214-1]
MARLMAPVLLPPQDHLPPLPRPPADRRLRMALPNPAPALLLRPRAPDRHRARAAQGVPLLLLPTPPPPRLGAGLRRRLAGPHPACGLLPPRGGRGDAHRRAPLHARPCLRPRAARRGPLEHIRPRAPRLWGGAPHPGAGVRGAGRRKRKRKRKCECTGRGQPGAPQRGGGRGGDGVRRVERDVKPCVRAGVNAVAEREQRQVRVRGGRRAERHGDGLRAPGLPAAGPAEVELVRVGRRRRRGGVRASKDRLSGSGNGKRDTGGARCSGRFCFDDIVMKLGHDLWHGFGARDGSLILHISTR